MQTFSHNTAKMYFIHGPEFISYALLPIGQLLEEAKNDRNKDFNQMKIYFE